MKRFKGLGIAISTALVLTLAFASAASAMTVIKLIGNYGDWGTSPLSSDGPETPGAKCGYSAANSSGTAHLLWLKVFPFKVAAFDRTAGVDQQNVTFMATVQHSSDNGTTWKNGSSVSETRTAWDNKSARFDTLKVPTIGKPGQVYRAIVTLKWVRNGQTDGLAKVSMDYYSVKWTVGDPAFVFPGFCTGVAD
jgi:hypothetical protein